jgi:DNA polymerase-1
MKSLTIQEILQYDSQPRTDEPDSFYTCQETQIPLKAKKQPSSIHSQTIKPIYQLIDRAEQLPSALAPFQSAKIIGIDCETTGLDPYRHRIRLVQLAIAHHPVLIIDLAAIEPKSLAPLREFLASNCLKVGHNLKFDWQFLAQASLTPNPPFFDTYLAYRVLTAGLKKNCSLEGISNKLLGISLDKTQQNSNFSGSLTSAQLQYAATDAAIVLPLYQVLKRQLEKATLTKTAQNEFNCLSAVAQMELNGIYLDLEKWQQMSDRAQSQLRHLEQQIARQLKPLQSLQPKQISLLPDFSDTINLRSPRQVKLALNELGIPVSSTNSLTLIPLAQDYPILGSLLEYRSLAARISTFAERLPAHIHPLTGRIHGSWFQMGAKSGRFSCRHPNLTNIPRDAQTRQCFTAQPGHVLIKADYSQIELRLIAKVSNDSRMSHAYQNGEDLHRLTAALIFDKPLYKVTDEERHLGKIINFGLIYGMGVNKFRLTTAKNHNILLSVREASLFRQKFFEAYPGLKAYQIQIRRQWQQGIRVSRTIDGRRRLWSKQRKPILNELLNHPIQGANATILKRAIALLGRYLTRTKAKLIAVVHDEILLECPTQEAKRVAALLKQCMVLAAKELLNPIPVEVDVKILPSWGG